MFVELQDARLRRCSLYLYWKKDMGSPHLAAELVAEGLLDRVHLHSQASPSGQLQQPMHLALFLTGLLSHAAREVAAEAATTGQAASELAAAVAQAAGELQQVDDRRIRSVPEYTAAAALWQSPARRLAAALLAWWLRPEAQPAAALEVAQAAVAGSCAYLHCANLGGEGGPMAGQGTGSMRCRCVDGGMGEECRCQCAMHARLHMGRSCCLTSCPLPLPLPCSACRAVWYCGTACSHADWRAGTAACARRWARRGRRRNRGGKLLRQRLERRRLLRDRRPERRKEMESFCVCDVYMQCAC